MRSDRRWVDRAERALRFVPVILFAALAWHRRWMAEDGFINLRVVEQVVAGHGPVYNAGQRVEAFTSPLWIAVLTVLRVVVGWAVPMEWVAVLAGLILAVAGVGLVVAGDVELQTAHRDGRSIRARRYYPAGVLVVLALPPMWDFATSGLETGLALCWLGGSFLVLARLADRPVTGNRPSTVDRPALRPLVAVLLGLGPLVRPELTLFSAAFAVVAWRSTAGSRRDRVRSGVALLALPVAYQVFRMGYYASLVPNTALAKEGGRSQVGRGWHYLANFTNPYQLWLPLALVVGLVAVTRPWRVNGAWGVLMLGLSVPALLNIAYVVWVGGDYMHGRFFVLPLVALLAPVAVVPALPRPRPGWVAQPAVLGLLALWAVVAGVGFRAPLQDIPAIGDERAVAVLFSGHEHPIRAGEQARLLLRAADELRPLARGDVLVGQLNVFSDEITVLPRRAGAGTVVGIGAIGVIPWRIGNDVRVLDVIGLADPLAARLPPNFEARAGHTHALSRDWVLAVVDVRPDHLTAEARAGRRALRCGALRRLYDDVDQPLTVGRFLGNLWDAPANTTLAIPNSPTAAEQKFC